jgi:hypothetical protein
LRIEELGFGRNPLREKPLPDDPSSTLRSLFFEHGLLVLRGLATFVSKDAFRRRRACHFARPPARLFPHVDRSLAF